MPDLIEIVRSGTSHAWLYLPFAVLVGALHALEPGHAKSMMAAYLVAIRGTAAQAIMLGVSATVGHTIIIWGLAVAALAFGERYIVEQAEPWLTAVSGILIVLLALRMFWVLRSRGGHRHSHGHNHDHGHTHEPPATTGSVTTGQIIWFGFSGGLMPCPSALAVLLICIQFKAFALGVAMVGAFSAGIGLTLVAIGLAVVWSSRRLSQRWPGFDGMAARLPYLSAGLVLLVGGVMTVAGLHGTGLFATKNTK